MSATVRGILPRRQRGAGHQQKNKADERRDSCVTMRKTRVKTAHAREQVREEC
jgi:hypothetical protein